MGALKAESTGYGFHPVLERGKNNSGGLTSVTHVAALAVLALSITLLKPSPSANDPGRHTIQAKSKVIKLRESYSSIERLLCRRAVDERGALLR